MANARPSTLERGRARPAGERRGRGEREWWAELRREKGK
jgi:hypothetical protein